MKWGFKMAPYLPVCDVAVRQWSITLSGVVANARRYSGRRIIECNFRWKIQSATFRWPLDPPAALPRQFL
jgi:hypothetical protein